MAPFRRPHALALATLLAVAGGLAFAQEEAQQRLFSAYQAHDWKGTEAGALELLAADAQNAQAHYFLAVALMHRDQPQEAMAQLDRAAELGYPSPAVEFRRACVHAAAGDLDAAFAALDGAVAQGFAQRQAIETEPLLAGLRADPRYQQTLAGIEKALHPCRNDPRYRQFDFWIGTWDVRPTGAPDSVPPSENVITLEYDDCVLMEHWRGTSGLTGSSFNLYDASRDEWFQTWVDSSGGLHEYHGKPDADGNMLFQGTTPGGPGQPSRVPTRLSFFRLGPDRVRQLSESSTDGGATWSVGYDLTYVRRPGTAAAP